MASRREYEMLFQLNAQMGGTFTGTFSKAQQQMLSLQKDIQALNNVQKDISAYQKQQQAVEGTQKKLETLQQQYDNIQKEIRETEGYSSDLENKLLSKQQQIDKTSQSLEQQTQKLNSMDAALKQAGVDTSNLEKESERLGSEMDELKKKQEEVAHKAGDFGEKGAQAVSLISDALAAAGIAAAFHEIFQEISACVQIAADFESSMSNVEAISGASAEELEQLSAMAKELGATTKFTARESADAMGYMAMAGWDAQQMLSGMPAVLQLAAASGEDLAMVSDIVTDSLTAFGLTAADTARFSDVLAASAANANTNVGIMGETFKYAAPVAGALGYSVEDVAVAIGLMANSGIKGSNAGTALRNTFNGLLEGVTLTSDAFGEYTYSAIRADGTMKDFGSTLDELRGYFDQMTEAERVNNAMAIAGQRGYAGLLAILNTTDEDYAKLTDNINNCSGAAQRMADIKMDNMNGQLTRLKSAWEAVQTTVGEELTPDLQRLYATLADILTKVNEFLAEHPGLVKAMVTFIGLLGGIAAGITAINAAAKAFKALNMASLFMGPTGYILAAGAAIAGVVAAVVALQEAAQKARDESWEFTATTRAQQEELERLNAEYRQTAVMYGETSAEAQMLKWRIDDLTESYEVNKQTFEDFQAAQKSMIDNYRDMDESFAENRRNLQNEANGIDALVTKLEELSSTAESAKRNAGAIQAIIDKLNEEIPSLNISWEDITSSEDAIAQIRAITDAVADQAYQAAQYQELVQRSYDAGTLKAGRDEAQRQRDLAQAEYDAAKKAYEEKAALYKYDNTGVGIVMGLMEEGAALDAAREQLEGYEQDLIAAEAAYRDNQAALDSLNGSIETHYEEIGDAGVAIESMMARIDSLTAAYNEAYEAAYDSVSGQYELWDTASAVVATSAGTINTALESQITYWQNYNANLDSLNERAADIEGLSDVIASFADGSAESVNAIAGMASASDEDLRAMVANYQTLQNAQEEVSQSIADLKTDFTNQMDELTEELAADIEAMDLSDEAARAAQSTLQGYIDAAERMKDDVRRAYADVGRAAAAALSSASGSNITVNTYGFAAGTEYAPPGLALVGEEGPELVMLRGGERILTAEETRELQKDYTLMQTLIPTQLNAYAIGSESAAPGLALVGEEGPELVMLRGGERILTAEETRELQSETAYLQMLFPDMIVPAHYADGAMPNHSNIVETMPLSHAPNVPQRAEAEEAIYEPPKKEEDGGGGGYTVTFAPVYNISGVSNPEELKEVLREHDDDLREQLEELLAEIESDRARRSYA